MKTKGSIFNNIPGVTAKCVCLAIIGVFIIGSSSCKKFLEVQPPNNVVTGPAVFQSDASATSAMVGVYSTMMRIQQSFSGNMTIDCGLYSDELSTSDPANQFMTSALTSDNTEVNSYWTQIYNYIYGANAVLQGVTGSSKITPAIKKQLEGEAKFVRAFGYFYLVNLYGDVPLVTATDYHVNSTIARTPATDVYKQIVADLQDATNLLASDYSFSNGEKVRPNKWAATALLARVYLYMGDWQDAFKQSDALISSNNFTLPSLAATFTANNTGAIWQLMPVSQIYDTFEGAKFIPPNNSALPNFPLENSLIQSIEPGDQRLTNWINSSTVGGQTYYYPFKYKVARGASRSEYYTVLRLAEQYLIRAEANAQLNNLPAAIADINTVRARAGLLPLAGTLTADQVLAAVAQERRIEFFAEWGHRWFDLKRTGAASSILGVLKPASWKNSAILWPVPVVQINANPALVQNSGY
ncbi:MAG: RagB/SusD family nutrient uptake outer membrane protein [Bacteroidetes bacterium]|nr:RagB/SusD family nutrient uptake outer membrane protein [Bacteroidota bacterium]